MLPGTMKALARSDASKRPRPAGAAPALALIVTVVALWAGALALVVHAGALAPQERGKLFVVFPPGTGAAGAFAAIVGAGGEPVRPALGGLAWVAHGPEPGFVGRLAAQGALAAFRNAPVGITLAGCLAFVHPEAPPVDPLARALEARLRPAS